MRNDLYNTNQIKIQKNSKHYNCYVNKNSKNIILWNVYSKSNNSIMKIAIIGIHRITKYNNKYQFLEVESLSEGDRYNLRFILDNFLILRDNFVDLQSGKRFSYPVISADYHDDDEYIFALVE